MVALSHHTPAGTLAGEAGWRLAYLTDMPYDVNLFLVHVGPI